MAFTPSAIRFSSRLPFIHQLILQTSLPLVSSLHSSNLVLTPAQSSFLTAHNLHICPVPRTLFTVYPQPICQARTFMSSSHNNPCDVPSPPQPPPAWNHTADQILSLTNQAITSSRQLLDRIGSIAPEKCTFESVILPLAENDLITAAVEILTFYQYVAPDEGLRNAAVEADKLIQEYDLEVASRADIYNAILAAKQNTNLAGLVPESQRLIDKLIVDRTQNGLHLPEQSRQKFNQLKSKINNLAIDFQKNLNEETGKIWFSLDELKGVPDDILSGFEKRQDGKLAMTFKTPDLVPVMQYAVVPETRKRASLGYDSKAAVNIPILEEIISLRQQASEALGKPNWATHALEVKMAKNPEEVSKFLTDLRDKITPVARNERDELLKLKAEEVKNLGLDVDPSKFYIWDYRYYDRLYTEKNLDLKAELVKEYFPVSVVVQVILETYQSLLSVKFFEIKDAQVWHPNASQWAVWDSEAVASGKASHGEGFLGYLHLDLEPRPNKYGHAAVWGLIPGYEKEDGTRNYPVAAMVANLAKGTAQKPALLTHDSVVTFFHEMGHVFHQLCSKTKYARFHGTQVARDFVEAPSQMLENWCWTESQLLKMSQHYERKSERLPAELIEKIIASRDVNSGLSNLRQIFFGMYDMFVHTCTSKEDLTRRWCAMRDEISLLDPSESQAPGQSGFGHIVGGYDAGYYGYLYSQVFSADMFESVFAKDPMSSASGMKYREEILKPGGSRDEMDSLTQFLGRPPTNEAFMKRILRNQ